MLDRAKGGIVTAAGLASSEIGHYAIQSKTSPSLTSKTGVTNWSDSRFPAGQDPTSAIGSPGFAGNSTPFKRLCRQGIGKGHMRS